MITHILALVLCCLVAFTKAMANGSVNPCTNNLTQISSSNNSSHKSLSDHDRNRYHLSLQSKVDAFREKGKAAVKTFLEGILSKASFDELISITESTSGVLTGDDLFFLAGYFAFFDDLNITKTTNVFLDIRVEGDSAYVLVPSIYSLIGSLDSLNLYWVHDQAWALERFINHPNGPNYLFGQVPGRSKFATTTTAPLDEMAKETVLILLGLKGYKAFDKPGPLYLVRASMTPELISIADPKVALIYKRRPNAESPWATADHFIENSIPGFTSGGLPEIVFMTFTVSAANLEDLKTKGGLLIQLNDSSL